MATITNNPTTLQNTSFGETVFVDWEEWLTDTLEIPLNMLDSQTPPVPINFTGCSAIFMILKDKKADIPLLQADSNTSAIVLGGTNNLVVKVTPTQIQAANLIRGKYYYKIIVTYSDGYVNTEMAGVLELK